MSIDINSQIHGLGQGALDNRQLNEIQPINPAEVARHSSPVFGHEARADAIVPAPAKVEAAAGQTVSDIINTPGTIAYQHMQNYLHTGDLASYNFAHFAAKMQLGQA